MTALGCWMMEVHLARNAETPFALNLSKGDLEKGASI
jgi:hypothetical protein